MKIGVPSLRALSGLEQGPRPGFHVAQGRRHPGIFGMRFQEWRGDKILSAWMSSAGIIAERFGHPTVHRLALHRPSRIIRVPPPNADAARAGIHVAAERALVGLALFLI